VSEHQLAGRWLDHLHPSRGVLPHRYNQAALRWTLGVSPGGGAPSRTRAISGGLPIAPLPFAKGAAVSFLPGALRLALGESRCRIVWF